MKKPIPLLALALAAASPLRADAILDWNSQALDAIRLSRTPPPQASYALAFYHAAIYDAVNGIERRYEPYHVEETAPEGASVLAAAAAAARVAFRSYLGKRTNPQPFEKAYREALAAIPDGPAKEAGVAWGERVARQILELRRDSGVNRHVEPVIGDKPGVWRPTPPNFRSPTDPHWGRVKPFAIESGDQFRPPPPPPLDSLEYAEAVDEVRRLGHRDSELRSEYETDSAVFWSDDLGTATPPGHWNVIAQDVARRKGLSLVENARLFALLNIAAADAGIAGWEAKYHYNFWRPEHAIREADTDGNPLTKPDPDFIPLMPSPTFPDYPSGHSMFSGTCSRILARFFGTDEISFKVASEGLPGDVRLFDSFSEAAREVGRSRIFGGIHYSFADVEGRKAAARLADDVYDNYLQPLDGK